LEGGAEAEWNEGAFSIAARAAANPIAAGAPAVNLFLEVDGDRKQWSVKSLDVEIPSGRIVLDHPISFGYGSRPAFSQAALDISADLAAVPLLHARGRLSGRMLLDAAAGKLPVATVDLTAKEAAWNTIPLGDYSISGRCDFQNRSVSRLRVEASWTGSALRGWLPRGVTVSRIAATATFDGPWPALSHAGSARVEGLSIPCAHVDAASLRWRGSGIHLDAFEARMATGKTTLYVAGSASLSGAKITDLAFAPDGKEALRLTAPADISRSPRFTVSPFSLKGGASEIAGAYSAASVSVRMNQIPSAWLRGVVDWQGPDFEISTATLLLNRAGNRMVFAVQAGAHLSVENESVALGLRADSDGNLIHLQELQAASATGILTEATGILPFHWDFSRKHWIADPDASLKLHARVDRASRLWEVLAKRLGITLSQAVASIDIDGSLNAPVGKFHLAVLRLSAVPGRTSLKAPPLDHLDVEAHADRTSVVVDGLSASVLGQALSGSGRLPMSAINWQSLLEGRGAIPWEKAEAHLAIENADVGSFAPLLPPLLAPRGHVRLSIEIKNGVWEGAIHLAALSLKPVAPVGLVQNITGDLVFSERTLLTKGLSAEVGGTKLTLDGMVMLPPGGKPIYSISLHGASIPLVRQASLLIRADLDLRAKTEAGATQVSGRIAVRDAILLGELGDLMPNGKTGGLRPAPYFSITAPSFRDWRLDVTLAAAHSLRAQTAIFSGRGSAQFQLTGTLGDPRATGRLQIDHGQILLPFATFDVQFGAVRLNADDPLHPQIDVRASARRYDYDLRMVATGPADAPVLRFTSNPALPSDQILALVMAGQSPQTGGLVGTNNIQVENLGAYVGQNLYSGFSGRPSTNRLSVTTGQELSVSGKPTYEIEYRLGRHWWLTGEYDIFDDFNGSIKWRVYSKSGNP
jgi:translocation and assembly module TamB